MKWKSGESRRDRLIELSDQHYRIVWEIIDSEPISEVTAAITTGDSITTQFNLIDFSSFDPYY